MKEFFVLVFILAIILVITIDQKANNRNRTNVGGNTNANSNSSFGGSTGSNSNSNANENINSGNDGQYVSPGLDTTIKPVKNTMLNISFPPVESQEQLDFTLEHLTALGAKGVRFSEEWKFREAERGVFKWASLDARINFFKENNIAILLTIQSNGPTWACSKTNEKSCVFSDLNAFRNYVAELLKRYPNKIDKIQFGNEWQSDYLYVGDEYEFVSAANVLYEEVQKWSPNTKVVLGGFSIGQLSGWAVLEGRLDYAYNSDGKRVDLTSIQRSLSDQQITALVHRSTYVLENAKYDLLDIHLYDDAENWSIYYQLMKDKNTKNKPIIVTEFGGPNLNVEQYSDDYQAERLRKYIEVIDSLGISEAYFFKLVESDGAHPAHIKSGLISKQLNIKPAYSVFQQFSK